MSSELQGVLRTIMQLVPRNSSVKFQYCGQRGAVTVSIDDLTHTFIVGGKSGVTLTSSSPDVFECHVAPISTDGSGALQHVIHKSLLDFIVKHSVALFLEEFKTCMALVLASLPRETGSTMEIPVSASDETPGWEDLFWHNLRGDDGEASS